MTDPNAFAIVDVGGSQCLARPREVMRVPRRKEQVGAPVTLEDVLFVRTPEDFAVGRPTVKGARVECEVKAHIRDRKDIAFRFRRRESVRRKRGFRRSYTDLWVKEIKFGGVKDGA
ncbi:MAG: 50S ribosomal protein L21 [Candidatus Omnitrophica bacterium]|nr:50S ribosomal protein L21 [Candidatus Omnitrophota bacterium]